MIALLLSIPSRIKLWLAAILAAAAGALAIYLRGSRDQKAKAKGDKLKQEVQAHDRINQADTGANLSDGERIDRLREFADRHGKRK